MFKSMKPEEYISQRVEDMRQWYDGKASESKKMYLNIRTIAVAGAVIVPVLANVTIPGIGAYQTLPTTLVSLMVSLAVALDSVFHFGDQWKNYRSSEQFLKSEVFLFRTGEGVYKGMEEDPAFLLFIERCEAQIAAENAATLNVIAPAPQQPSSAEGKALGKSG